MGTRIDLKACAHGKPFDAGCDECPDGGVTVEVKSIGAQCSRCGEELGVMPGSRILSMPPPAHFRESGALCEPSSGGSSITADDFAELLDHAKNRRTRTFELETTVKGAPVKLKVTFEPERRAKGEEASD